MTSSACRPGSRRLVQRSCARTTGLGSVDASSANRFASGADTRLAKRLYQLFRTSGLEDVRYRPFLVGVTSGEPMADYLPATIESVRSTLIGTGIIAEAELDAGHRVHELHDRPGLGVEAIEAPLRAEARRPCGRTALRRLTMGAIVWQRGSDGPVPERGVTSDPAPGCRLATTWIPDQHTERGGL